MNYTLTSGVRNYNKRLHYSLYGGVEYEADRTLAIKELLPLAAIPAVSIAMLVALLNFHIPKLSPQGGSGAGSLSIPGSGISALLSANSSHSASSTSKPGGSTTKPKTAVANSKSKAAPTSTPTVMVPSTVSGPLPSGNDNGQGIIGGTGGGGGGVTSPVPTPDPTPIPTPTPTPLTIGTNTPVGSASTTTTAPSQPTQSQTTLDVTVPLTGTSVSGNVSL